MSLLTPLFWIVLILPFLVWAYLASSKGNIKYLLLFLLCFLVDSYLQFSGKYFVVNHIFGMKFNWVGKILSLIFSLSIIFSTSKEERIKIGFTKSVLQKTVKRGIIIFFIVLVFDTVFKYFVFPKGQPFDLETFLFQATMPGLTEELLFRGIYLWLLSKVLLPKWTIKGVPFGWGFIIVNVLFGIAHGSIVTEDLKIKFDIVTILYITVVSSLSLGFLRKFSGNIFYSIVGHNTINLINAIIRII